MAYEREVHRTGGYDIRAVTLATRLEEARHVGHHRGRRVALVVRQVIDAVGGHADVIQPFGAQFRARACRHRLLDVIAIVMPTVEPIPPDEAVVGGLVGELALAVDGPRQQPAGILCRHDAAGDDLSRQRVAVADRLDGVQHFLVGRVDGPGFPARLFDVFEELLGMAEVRRLRGDFLPQLHRGAFAVLDGDDRGGVLASVGGAIALRTVRDEHEVVFGQVDGLGDATLRVFDALGNLLRGRHVAHNVRDLRVVLEYAAGVLDVLDHRFDH